MNTTNPQPTQAAIECARWIDRSFANNLPMLPDELESLARKLDTITNLPALTAIALAAQGVVDAVGARKAIAARKGAEITLQEAETVLSGIDDAIETLAATLEELKP